MIASLASLADVLRLLAVPILGWAAYRDVRTRRVPNETWYPLVAIAVVALLLDAQTALAAGAPSYFVRVAISIGFIVPLAYGFWWMGGFGGADAKAFIVLAVLFPVYPRLYLETATLPLEPSQLGVFSITILSNTVVVGLAYPVAVALGNLLRGHVAPAMLLGKPIRWHEATDEYGRLLEDGSGFTRNGLDLDALRMYLRWRGATLADLRADPDGHRDPNSLPASPNAPGDGSIDVDGESVATDGGSTVPDGGTTPADDGTDVGDGATTAATDGASAAAMEATADEVVADETGTDADPWGAAAFLDDIEHSAYGATAEELREGLDLLVERDVVWLSPGIPFIVPTFFGLLVALTYGDLLYVLMRTLGLTP